MRREQIVFWRADSNPLSARQNTICSWGLKRGYRDFLLETHKQKYLKHEVFIKTYEAWRYIFM